MSEETIVSGSDADDASCGDKEVETESIDGCSMEDPLILRLKKEIPDVYTDQFMEELTGKTTNRIIKEFDFGDALDL